MNEEIKKEARELVDHHRTYVRMADKYGYLLSDDEIHLAKQHALKTVREIWKVIAKYHAPFEDKYKYYEQLEQAIEQL